MGCGSKHQTTFLSIPRARPSSKPFASPVCSDISWVKHSRPLIEFTWLGYVKDLMMACSPKLVCKAWRNKDFNNRKTVVQQTGVHLLPSDHLVLGRKASTQFPWHMKHQVTFKYVTPGSHPENQASYLLPPFPSCARHIILPKNC